MPLPKSEVITTVTCAICGCQKSKVNGWWALSFGGSELSICPWGDEGDDEKVSYVCGQEHLIQYVQLYIDEVKRRPKNEDH